MTGLHRAGNRESEHASLLSVQTFLLTSREQKSRFDTLLKKDSAVKPRILLDNSGMRSWLNYSFGRSLRHILSTKNLSFSLSLSLSLARSLFFISTFGNLEEKLEFPRKDNRIRGIDGVCSRPTSFSE